jgi:hypothetical protein
VSDTRMCPTLNTFDLNCQCYIYFELFFQSSELLQHDLNLNSQRNVACTLSDLIYINNNSTNNWCIWSTYQLIFNECINIWCIWSIYKLFNESIMWIVARETTEERMKKEMRKEEGKGSHYRGWYDEKACTRIHHHCHRRFQNQIGTLL